MRQNNRELWTISGDGVNCEWTGSSVFDPDSNPYGTLFASYPASGMRIAWQYAEAITGKQLRDDFFALQFPKIGLIKTQYPHYEGIWSYGDSLDQVILVIRNPRWGIPSYHTLLSEIGYAHTWELAYDELDNVFTRRAPMEDWIKWRDYRIDDEINLWGHHIDYYMGNGSQYWMDEDFERNGQWPFPFRNATDRPQDSHCAHDMDCIPKRIISYDRLSDPIAGPDELRKIADTLRGVNPDMVVIPDSYMDCIWHETIIHTPEPSNDNRDLGGLSRTAYNFTLPQLTALKEKVEEYKDKYSMGTWTTDQNAIDLVSNFNEYINEFELEIAERTANPEPTPAPDAGYLLELQDWYKSKGKGDRYDQEKLETMGIWDQVSSFYD